MDIALIVTYNKNIVFTFLKSNAIIVQIIHG